MKFTQIRHGTCIIELDNTRFLLDPILYQKNTLAPVKGGIEKHNPLTDISVGENILKEIDVILLTHLHRDHFDPEIINYYGKDIPVICSDEYEKKLLEHGFTNVSFLKDEMKIKNLKIILTKGKHGSGAVGISMGKSYGFIIKSGKEGTVYITGDTIWCRCVEGTLEKYNPDFVIGYAGSAIIENTHITLNEEDIKKILKKSPNAKIIANHMDAWNHCVLTKEKLRTAIKNENLIIPNDGEMAVF